ncbi:MAG: hypothetical protein IMW89_13435 [Ktedonobacteraceae bacterium]|nr:hypothetical protein [Ktedonobacteraceae bacterium]MBE3560206.1 hypothetical protein [Ktedonobacteraceae bacterium]
MRERRKKVTLEQLYTLHPFDPPYIAANAKVSTETVYRALQQLPIFRREAERILNTLSRFTNRLLTLAQVEIVTWEEHLLLWVVRVGSGSAGNGEQGSAGVAVPGVAVPAEALAPVAAAAARGALVPVPRERYHLVYARDQEQAAQMAQPWLAQYPELKQQYFTPCPEGLRVQDFVVPGYLLVHEDDPRLL